MYSLDIYKNIEAGRYKTSIEYPKRPQMLCHKCGKLFGKDHKFCRECGANIANQLEIETESYKEAQKKYGEDQCKKSLEFRKDAFEYVGLEPGKVADIVYSKAEMDGHSGGFPEMLSHLIELISFIDELKKAGF